MRREAPKPSSQLRREREGISQRRERALGCGVAVWGTPELLWVPVPVPAACPVCSESRPLADSPLFARFPALCTMPLPRCGAERTGRRLRGAAGAPGSAMPLPALGFLTNDNTLPLFSAFHPQGSRGTPLLTSCYVRYLYASPPQLWERRSLEHGTAAEPASSLEHGQGPVGCSVGLLWGQPFVLGPAWPRFISLQIDVCRLSTAP